MKKYIIEDLNHLRHTDNIYVSIDDVLDVIFNAQKFVSRSAANRYIRNYLPKGLYQIVPEIEKG
jgi:hypothetical protein